MNWLVLVIHFEIGSQEVTVFDSNPIIHFPSDKIEIPDVWWSDTFAENDLATIFFIALLAAVRMTLEDGLASGLSVDPIRYPVIARSLIVKILGNIAISLVMKIKILSIIIPKY